MTVREAGLRGIWLAWKVIESGFNIYNFIPGQGLWLKFACGSEDTLTLKA